MLIVDVAMAASTPGIGDEAEAQTVPYILGIAHPTGFPFYVLAGWLWSHVLAFGTIAWRFNVLMAFVTALSAAGVVLLAVAAGADVIASAFAGLVFAFGGWVWIGAMHANAQPLGTMLSIYALAGCVAFARTGERRFIIGAAICNGLAIVSHPMALFVLPAIAVALAWQWRALRIRLLATCAAAIVAPLALYAYMPLRALAVARFGGDPTYGPPLNGAGSTAWNLHGLLTVSGFSDVLFARAVSAPQQLAHTGDVASLPAAAQTWFGLVSHNFFIGTFVLAALGILALARENLRALTILAAGTLGGIAFTYVYRTDVHIDRYVVLSSAVTAALAAALSCARLPRVPQLAMRGVVAALLAALCIRAIAINAKPVAAYAATTESGTVIAAVAAATPPNAIVIANWNFATPLAYAAYAERTLGSRLIVTGNSVQFRQFYRIWAVQRPTFIIVRENDHRLELLPGYDTFHERPFTLEDFSLYEVESPRSTLRR